jgi:anti-sigma-K factor RskA
MYCEEVREAAGAFALRALPPEEMREVEAHLAECDLHEEMASLRATASLLAFAAEEREPPAALQSRIMGAISGADGAQPATPLPFSAVRRREPRRIRPSYAVAAAFALLALGLLAWNVMLLQTDEEPQQVVVPAPTVTGGATSVLVRHVTTGPGAGTVLRYIQQEQVSILQITGLPPLEEGRTFQLWTLQGKDVTSVGLFTTGTDGTARVAFSRELHEGDTVAVTEEPAGGSPQPTSEPIFTITI